MICTTFSFSCLHYNTRKPCMTIKKPSVFLMEFFLNLWNCANCCRCWIDWQIRKPWTCTLLWCLFARWQNRIAIRWHKDINHADHSYNNLDTPCHSEDVWCSETSDSAAEDPCCNNVNRRKCRLWRLHSLDNFQDGQSQGQKLLHFVLVCFPLTHM